MGHAPAVDALFDRMRSAWRAGDAAGFASCFASEARVIAFHGRPFATHPAGTEAAR